VVGAVVLAIIGVGIFGSGGLFDKKRYYVAFFEGSVYGLYAGSPVTFRGVPIGLVTDVSALWLVKDGLPGIKIQVTMQLERDPVKQLGTDIKFTEISDQEVLDFLVNERGLRAKLTMQSIVTGQLYVDMDFYPKDSEKLLMGVETRHPEVPTTRSGFERLAQTLQSLPVEKMAYEIVDVLEGIDALVSSGEMQSMLRGADATVSELQQLVRNVNQRLAPLVDGLLAAASAARTALAQAEKTLTLEEGVPGELAADFEQALAAATAALTQARVTLTLEQGMAGQVARGMVDATDAARAAMAQADDTLKTFEGLVSQRSPVRGRLMKALDELAAAARSLRIMADYLQRHPEALLRGKR
jgi:paraquat-inducible protein B